MRLTRGSDFKAVYRARVRAAVGPLVVWAAPNEAGRWRLGLAVSRRVGTAVVRNRIRRCVREAFRLRQHELAACAGGADGYDLVVNVRRHEPLAPADYEKALLEAVRSIHGKWSSPKKQRTEQG